jgi:thiosulfate dehydrogenase [quinone] large subunit
MTLHKTTPPSTGNTVSGEGAVYEEDVLRSSSARKVLAGLRIVIGWYFLWAFIDKIFGFGYLTPAGKGLIDGGHPARGYLGGSLVGSLASSSRSGTWVPPLTSCSCSLCWGSAGR